MTETSPRDDASISARLTALETGLRHFQEICEIRNQQTKDTFFMLQDRNGQQDRDLKQMEERLLTKIEDIEGLLWSGMKWLGGFLAVTLCTIVLKALHLV